MRFFRSICWPVAVCAALLAAAPLVVAQPANEASLDQLAEALVQLRAEVESLDQELDILSQEHRHEMTSLAAQKTDLEANRNRLRLSLAQQQSALEDNRRRAEAAGMTSSQLTPLLLSAVEDLDQMVAASLPFKREARRMELADIRQQIQSGVIDSHRMVNRLWAFVEDEIRLSRENGIYSQTIELNGEQVLADVAKLGSVMLFFQTDDQRVGLAEKSASGAWSFSAVDDTDGAQAIAGLFDSLRKQIRQGYFQLPHALPR